MLQAHTKEEFDTFMSQLVETNATLDFFCDFSKISRNVEAMEIKLNQLNFLIGKENLEQAVHRLWDENPRVFDVLEMLIAVRRNSKRKYIAADGNFRLIENLFTSPEGVVAFIRETGLADIFSSRRITNLVDYVFGVETGLDTNARKNRSGKTMERLVASIFANRGIAYRTQVSSKEFSALACLGNDEKRFDFMIRTEAKTYLIEVNFYSGGGSKLNEVARSYSEIAPKINAQPGLEFVWITDGTGWYSARTKLEEAFRIIPSVYNLATLDRFIASIGQKAGER